MSFDQRFALLTGKSPFPWQRELFDRLVAGRVPATVDVPTGLGKTSVIAVWLLARAAGAPVPRRLVYVVNRRTVVDQTAAELERIRANREAAGVTEDLAISTLRGQLADNRAWSADPSRPAVICGTVDMIGSRLLFGGYRIGFRSRPLHAGFLGQDALVVHDEAHLEPAFQQLLETIESVQRADHDPWTLRVMALTATPRHGQPELQLGDEDRAHPVVSRRLHAVKRLTLHEHGARDLAERMVARALAYRESGGAVLVFLRTVDDVTAVAARLAGAGQAVQQLTGTMRGLERDRLVDEPAFRRFLPPDGREAAAGTVYLVCTSAGEVGVNLSADHLVCDLSTFDSMAQRFGRVNRFGDRDDTEVHVFHPTADAFEDDPVDQRRLITLELVRGLRGDASPAALTAIEPAARLRGFAPEPTTLPTTPILLDAWAMTTIAALPGRPPVAPYLHGVVDWEPPTMHVAWRDEVDLVRGELLDQYPARDLLDDYPLKPHELLTDRTARVLATLEQLAAAVEAPEQVPVWLVASDGTVEARLTLATIVSERKINESRFADCTLLLSPRTCRPVGGRLAAGGSAIDEGAAPGDVADLWLGAEGEPLRVRTFGAARPAGMRLIRTIVLVDDERASEDDPEAAGPRRWSWYEVPRTADNEGSRSATAPVTLEVHSADAEREAARIVSGLALDPGVARAVVLAARLHDLGKRRRVWQRSIGNHDRDLVLAKSGGTMRPLELTAYRHELGSILDAERDGLLAELSAVDRELALHLVAAHHGRARPCFPADELFDPEVVDLDLRDVGARVMERFASLQRRYGRWGLAYLESLVRAADYAASAAPSSAADAEVAP